MRAGLRHIVFAFFLFSPGLLLAQFNPDKICTIENGRTVFTLDLRWSPEERNQLSILFDLDTALLIKVYEGESEIVLNNLKWKVKKIKPNIVELSKSLENKPNSKITKNDVFIADDSWLNIFTGAPPVPADFGVNKLIRKDVFYYQDNIALFYLPAYKNAKKVFISGSFNNWNTSQTPMVQCDSGWLAKLKLLPGKYTYKFILDGRWTEDPNNKLREKDGKGNSNSVIFCYNFSFHLYERKEAKKVIVAGSFNSWHRDELRMDKTPNGWVLPLYLREGTHSYKFIADNEWLTDPDNKDIRPDEFGNLNSIVGIGDAYIFQLKGYQLANKVILTGNFNKWNRKELQMEKVSDGWQLSHILEAGMYEYKFIVDGQWIPDPDNPYSVGSGNFENSVLAYKANHIFVLKNYSESKTVIVTGNFNKWNQKNYRMLFKDGKWIFPIYLSPGKYIYKFIVDGKWIPDPDNKLWEENEYNTNNSVLWITQ